jgi:hypothetical protein
MENEEFSVGTFVGAGFLGQTWLIQGLADRGVITPQHGANLLRAMGKASKSAELADTMDRAARLVIAHRRHKKGPRRK